MPEMNRRNFVATISVGAVLASTGPGLAAEAGGGEPTASP